MKINVNNTEIKQWLSPDGTWQYMVTDLKAAARISSEIEQLESLGLCAEVHWPDGIEYSCGGETLAFYTKWAGLWILNPMKCALHGTKYTS